MPGLVVSAAELAYLPSDGNEEPGQFIALYAFYAAGFVLIGAFAAKVNAIVGFLVASAAFAISLPFIMNAALGPYALAFPVLAMGGLVASIGVWVNSSDETPHPFE